MGSTDRNLPRSFEDMAEEEVVKETTKEHVTMSVDGLTIETTAITPEEEAIADKPSE